jgi:hypothetical protein
MDLLLMLLVLAQSLFALLRFLHPGDAGYGDVRFIRNFISYLHYREYFINVKFFAYFSQNSFYQTKKPADWGELSGDW